MIPADSRRTSMRVIRTAEATVTMLLGESLNAKVNMNQTHIDLKILRVGNNLAVSRLKPTFFTCFNWQISRCLRKLDSCWYPSAFHARCSVFTNSRLVAEDAIALLIGSGTIDFTNPRLVAEDDRLALFVFS